MGDAASGEGFLAAPDPPAAQLASTRFGSAAEALHLQCHNVAEEQVVVWMQLRTVEAFGSASY